MRTTKKAIRRIAILGGGPSGLFMYKRLVETGNTDFEVSIFEATDRLGEGFPYSPSGANNEHVTNVSGNEIPEMEISVSDWIKTVPVQLLETFDIDPNKFNDYKVLPRLLFGKYLAAQFELLQVKAKHTGISTTIHFNSKVTDIIDHKDTNTISVEINQMDYFDFDTVVLCTGHIWPRSNEIEVPGFFDSPYPPGKLTGQWNHPVAIRGASLTAVDAIRTLARQHGVFSKTAEGEKTYRLNDNADEFKIVMHSRNGMLPAIRFHLEDPHLSKSKLLSEEEIAEHIKHNDGFLSLDFIFDRDFKETFRHKDPLFFEKIKNMNVEEFVSEMMSLRESVGAFELFKGEYAEAAKSIRRKESVYWKEMLAILSFALNYPAKHLSAEDMGRLQKVLMPLISIVIAFVPQNSCEELIALHDAGILTLVGVGADSKVVPQAEGGIIYHHEDDNGDVRETRYSTYVDCVGQPHLSLSNFPFQSLVTSGTVSPARLKFRSAEAARAQISQGNTDIEQAAPDNYYLPVPGIAINDYFQPVDKYGAFNDRLYIMAVPYIGGFNPDYSGLDFCDAASEIIVRKLITQLVV